MTRRFNLLLTTAMLAGLCVSGLAPASAQKSPNTPNISPMRPDFNMRAPNSLRDRDVSDPDEAEAQKKKANRHQRRAVQKEDFPEKAGALPSVRRAKASRQNKKTKSVRRQGGTPDAPCDYLRRPCDYNLVDQIDIWLSDHPDMMPEEYSQPAEAPAQ